MPASTCCSRCASRRSFAASPRTLASGSAAVSDWRYLSARRLALFVMTSIERGTRWMLFERNAQATWIMARAQVEAFLDSLYAEGAFAGRTGEQSYFVVCDERINNEETMRAGKINLAFGFAATKPGEYHAFLVTHQPSGSRARPISVNRFANYSPSVDLEIESSHPARPGAARPVVPPLTRSAIVRSRNRSRPSRKLKSARSGMLRPRSASVLPMNSRAARSPWQCRAQHSASASLRKPRCAFPRVPAVVEISRWRGMTTAAQAFARRAKPRLAIPLVTRVAQIAIRREWRSRMASRPIGCGIRARIPSRGPYSDCTAWAFAGTTTCTHCASRPRKPRSQRHAGAIRGVDRACAHWRERAAAR